MEKAPESAPGLLISTVLIQSVTKAPVYPASSSRRSESAWHASYPIGGHSESAIRKVAAALIDEPAVHLETPHGCFVLARLAGAAVGIGGVRFRDCRTAELTKMFTLPSVRGLGVASSVLQHLESRARNAGLSALRLDTRSDLGEACRLYERRGYLRVEPFGESVYSDRWYELPLHS